MSKDVVDVVIQAVMALMTIAALVVSIVAIRRSSPRLVVTADKANVLFGPPIGARPMVCVGTVNNGGAAAYISDVFLLGTDGSGSFHFSESMGRGPKLPHRLEAHGGSAGWMFDYAELRRSYDRTPRDEVLMVVACVRLGARTLRAKSRIAVNQPGAAAVERTMRERLMDEYRSWRAPRVQFSPWETTSLIDLDLGTAPLAAQNDGRWWSKPFTVTLVAEKDGGIGRERVPGVQQVRFPRIAPSRVHEETVSLVDDPPQGTTLWWQVTAGRGIGNGVAATTWSRARKLKASHNGREKAENPAVGGAPTDNNGAQERKSAASVRSDAERAE